MVTCIYDTSFKEILDRCRHDRQRQTYWKIGTQSHRSKTREAYHYCYDGWVSGGEKRGTGKMESQDEKTVKDQEQEQEWLELFLEAKRIGLTINEVRNFFKKVSDN